MANQLLRLISADDLVKEEILARERYHRIKNTEIKNAWMQGEENGKRIGLEDGKRIGLEDGKKQLILKMLSKGRSAAEISLLTDIPIEKINAMMS